MADRTDSLVTKTSSVLYIPNILVTVFPAEVTAPCSYPFLESLVETTLWCPMLPIVYT